jgi:hypothetical protein
MKSSMSAVRISLRSVEPKHERSGAMRDSIVSADARPIAGAAFVIASLV